MSDKIRIAIHGAAGRMGQRLIALGSVDPALQIVAALEHAGSSVLGKDAGEHAGIGKLGVPFTAELKEHVDAVIDFSTPEGAMHIVKFCAERRIPLVEATTGLSTDQREEILEAAQETAIVQSPSMSLAVNVAMKLVGEAARALKNVPSGVDVEVVERHHRFKEDAPSGTALKFGQIVADEMGQTEQRHGRHGQTGQRPRQEIGYHALRTGDNVGEHQIVFGLMGETLEVYVRGHTRDSYAYGALAAAKFVATKSAGMYTMADVLGL
ncbi:4-hydroxy-tetrahydrodipicolinate reductase [Planctomicrobium piriforme]|uniref:4-hydroxy-tetrahydrodipicolinate reductase n=1 Tax=Planctomicrobium piriforme TaxID=1576369 RepID=A0A1I3IAH7_9PLAN|nr:4-hydroxy-tetrahydrodipicolinate reductase [Planctomicrobium piriforme]SFI44899.1 4-hydroxy-tetrahydrodipicolinate reductase [Planctomicrobium piriforme]